ncbi:glycosyltransferase [Novosphingobium lentum]|uniref:glycosyltransferase n=1 Tax=Novosphingobium lentum TaxID=145287 RepID=UPI00082BC100|nr:glycosyltransferase [Novosphingobium lentum]
MDCPAFSIIVPTYQRRDVVCDAVRAIARIAYDGAIELIVVIDGSSDGTAQALAELTCPFSFRVIEQANTGAAGARNRGAAAAQGDILLFLDDDMICAPDIVAQHARSMGEGADAVLGDLPLDPASPSGFLAQAVGRWAAARSRALAAGAPLTVFDLLTGQISIRRTVFEAIGGFDGRFTHGGSFGNEDLDMGVRLLEAHDVRFNPLAISHQRYVVTPRQHLAQWRQAGEADVLFARKHPTRAAELFDLHGASRIVTRWIMAPLARIAGLSRGISALAVWLVDQRDGTAMPDQLAFRFFLMARDLAYWSGVAARGGIPGKRTALVLCYHAIADLSDDPVLAQYGIAPAAFAAQIDDLVRRGYSFIAPGEWSAALAGEAGLPRRAVLLTFDDCYAELPEIARTVLAPRGIQALAFAVSGLCSNTWDQPLGARALALLERAGLAALTASGIEIGCHSRSHRELPRLSDAELDTETHGAAGDLAATGLPRPRFYAYPYGESDARSRAAVRKAGFSAAFGLRRARATGASDRFDLPRVEILARDSGWRFRLKTGWPRLAAVLR